MGVASHLLSWWYTPKHCLVDNHGPFVFYVDTCCNIIVLIAAPFFEVLKIVQFESIRK